MPLTGKLAEPTTFILKQNSNRYRSCTRSGFIHVIHYNELRYTLTMLRSENVKKHGGETAEEADRQ